MTAEALSLDATASPDPVNQTLQRDRESTTDKGLEFWIAIVTAACAVASFLFGIYQFQDVRSREIRKPLYEEKLKVYSEVADLLSKMAAPSFKESRSAPEATAAFWALYQGRAVIVANEEAYDAMANAAGYVATCIDGIHKRYKGDCNPIEMVVFSRNFANVVRKELRGFWGSGLEGNLSDES